MAIDDPAVRAQLVAARGELRRLLWGEGEAGLRGVLLGWQRRLFVPTGADSGAVTAAVRSMCRATVERIEYTVQSTRSFRR